MSRFLESYAIWLADYYLLSTVLLSLAWVAVALLKQPAHRLAITKSTFAGMLLLAILCAVPGWSVVHLLSSERQQPIAEPRREVAPTPAVASVRPESVEIDAHNLPSPQAANLPLDEPLSTLSHPLQIDWPIVLPIAHLAGAGGIAVWLLVGLIASALLRRGAGQTPPDVINILNDVIGANPGRAGRLRLLTHDQIDVAVALGIWQPTILLPTLWAQNQSRNQLRAVLAHESTHVFNHDLQWLTATRVLLLALWAHPLFWIARRRLRLDQESLADAAAGEVTGRQQYAEQLVAWARRVGSRPSLRLSSAVGLWEGPSQLRRRIALLIDERLIVLRTCSRPWTMTATAVSFIAATSLSLISLQPAIKAAVESNKASSSESSAKPLQYTGTVVDKRTGKPIAGATVVVRRMTSSKYPWPTLAESKHVTAADGTYKFTIPPEQVADKKLYIELDVTHTDYAPRTGFGYALSMIRKNEKLGGRPFFDRVELEPAQAIAGLVKKPNGESLSDCAVLAYSKADPKDLSEYGSFARGKTNNEGRFRLNVTKNGKAVLWLLPAEFSQQTHVIGEKRGDLGTFALEDGSRLNGRVLDRDGKPIAGVWVNAELIDGPAKQPIDMPVADSIERSALTDADGTFKLGPLPTGTYRVLPQENPAENPNHDREARPLPAVFLPKRVTLTGGEIPKPLTIQAVEIIVIEAQIYDSAGKPRSGHEVDFFGRVGDARGESYFSQGRPDASGHIILTVPKGLQRAELNLTCNEHQVLRYRWSPKGDLRAERKVEFPTLDHDYRGLEIIYYTAPIVIVDARDRTGNPIRDFKPAIQYRANVKPRDVGSHWISGVEGEVNFEKQEDGRWRSDQLLPSQEFVLNVMADGYRPAAEVMSLKEGQIKELTVVLAPLEADKDDARGRDTPRDRRPKDNPTTDATKHSMNGKRGATEDQREFPIIVAKHVLLLNGAEIITWGDLDAKIAALHDPSSAYPAFYVTHGVIGTETYKAAKERIWELHRKYKLKGHSEGTLAARTSFRYDKIHDKSDLVPDPSLRVEGTVLGRDGKPVAGAEVILITPVDESLSYKAYDIAVVEGRVRNRLDEVVTDTYAAGRFAIYPPKGQKYFVVAMHPEHGFSMARDTDLAREPGVALVPWAALTSELAPEPGKQQTASLNTRLPNDGGYPEVTIAQYWSDLNREKPTKLFGFTHVPAIFPTSISRDFTESDGGSLGINAASVSLLPGEQRRLDLGPLSEKQREHLKQVGDELKRAREQWTTKDVKPNPSLPARSR